MIKSKSFLFLRSAAALLLMLFATAACGCIPCGMSDEGSTSYVSAPSYIQMAPMAPPSPMYEEKPEIETPRTKTWRPGYWDFSGGDFHWVSGEIIDRPSPTAIWSPDHWVEHKYGWGFVPGYWQ